MVNYWLKLVFVFLQSSSLAPMLSIDERQTERKNANQLRKELYTAKDHSSKSREDLKEPGLLSRWPKFLQLEMKLPKPSPTEVLANMRLMCPCEPVTNEEIAAIIEEKGPFKTPEWQDQSETTRIPPRVLSIAEVEVINKVYLDLKDELRKKRQEQTVGQALGDIEHDLAAQASAAEERTSKMLATVEERLCNMINKNHREIQGKLNVGFGKKVHPVDYEDMFAFVPAENEFLNRGDEDETQFEEDERMLHERDDTMVCGMYYQDEIGEGLKSDWTLDPDARPRKGRTFWNLIHIVGKLKARGTYLVRYHRNGKDASNGFEMEEKEFNANICKNVKIAGDDSTIAKYQCLRGRMGWVVGDFKGSNLKVEFINPPRPMQTKTGKPGKPKKEWMIPRTLIEFLHPDTPLEDNEGTENGKEKDANPQRPKKCRKKRKGSKGGDRGEEEAVTDIADLQEIRAGYHKEFLSTCLAQELLEFFQEQRPKKKLMYGMPLKGYVPGVISMFGLPTEEVVETQPMPELLIRVAGEIMQRLEVTLPNNCVVDMCEHSEDCTRPHQDLKCSNSKLPGEVESDESVIIVRLMGTRPLEFSSSRTGQVVEGISLASRDCYKLTGSVNTRYKHWIAPDVKSDLCITLYYRTVENGIHPEGNYAIINGKMEPLKKNGWKIPQRTQNKCSGAVSVEPQQGKEKRQRTN